MKSAFSAKTASSDVIVIDSIKSDSFSTKTIAAMLKAVGSEKKALIVLPTVDKRLSTLQETFLALKQHR